MHEEEEVDDISYTLTGEELRDTVALTPDARRDYFVEKVKSEGHVWTLGAEDELIVLAGEDDTPFIVAFPHPEFAQEWIEGTDIEEVELVAVGTEDWAKEILPGLQEAGIKIMIFPTSEAEGVGTEADDLAKLLI